MKIATALEQIRGEVMGAAVAADGRLPTERELAARLGVSRGTLRQALAQLEKDGSIWRGVGRGTYVRGHEPEATSRSGLVLDTTNPTQVMEARLVFEPELAAVAALKATPAEIAALEESVARGRRAQQVSEFERCDSQFHRALAAAADNMLLLGLFDALNAARDGTLWGRLKEASLTPERMVCYCDQHQAIVDALRDRDRTAASHAMRAHLRTVQANLLAS
jgi:GntR family uxuAB operon transcriptional repressor